MKGVTPWDPLRLGCGTTLRNRFVLAPMTTDSSHHDGTISDDELNYIRRRISNGFAAGVTSCAYVHRDGRSWRGIGADHDGQLPSLARAADAFRAGGGLAILQLYDGGRIASTAVVGPDRLRAPSPVASARPGALEPREMTLPEIAELIEGFVAAARRGERAGFDGIELHGANHYLLHQFFSPRANRRTDHWGGDFERRMRFPLALMAAVRDRLRPSTVLGYRVNPFESETGGFTLEQVGVLVERLCDLNLDYLHISMDDFRRRSPMREDRDWTSGSSGGGDRDPIAAMAGAAAGRCAVVASGGIRSLDDAQTALNQGADLVAVGRAALIDPDWVAKVSSGREETIRAALPEYPDQISAELSIPPPMVDYLLSRPGWIPRVGTESGAGTHPSLSDDRRKPDVKSTARLAGGTQN